MKNITNPIINIADFIDSFRNSDRYIKAIYTEGGCYQFHLLLKRLYPDCKPFINSEKNHVISLYRGKFYDVTGECPDNGYLEMTEDDKQKAEKWSFHKNMALQVNECPACGEPIII